MARVYRPTYRKFVGGQWVTKRYAKWYAKVMVNGVRKAVPLTTDKRASEIMLADLLKREAMGQAGAVDPFAACSRVPLSKHLADWQSALRFRGATEKHVIAAGKLVTRFLDSSRSVFPADATADAVTRFLESHQASGVSPRTINWTGNTLRAFFAWMVRACGSQQRKAG